MRTENVYRRWRGSRLKAAREKRGLTRSAVAAELGVTERTIWSWEEGNGNARPFAVRLAEYLGVEASDIAA